MHVSFGERRFVTDKEVLLRRNGIGDEVLKLKMRELRGGTDNNNIAFSVALEMHELGT